jgi:translation initiation factor IF-3
MPWAISAQLRGVSRGGGRGGKREDVTKKNLIPAHRINEQIESRQVRLVIDSGDGGDGESSSSKSHEVISTIVARKRAKEAGLDLVEMNAKAVPPVCRMLDYDAFRYELRLKEKEARKKAVERRRHDQVKELRLSARISANDLGTKADQANKFLEQGHKVTARIEFKSNDGVKAKMRPDAGAILYAEFRALLNAHRVEVEPKMVGPSHMILQIAAEREKKGSTKKKEPVNVKKEETPVEKETAKEETATVS